MKYVLLLRGINVGGKNKVSMADLKDAIAYLGYKNVITYINSGNIIFDTTENIGVANSSSEVTHLRATAEEKVDAQIRDLESAKAEQEQVKADRTKIDEFKNTFSTDELFGVCSVGGILDVYGTLFR